MKSLESTKNKSAFSFCRGDSSSGDYEDLTLVCNEIERDINNLKSELSSLYKTLLEDINNINKELEYNFGWAVAGQYKKESIQNENIDLFIAEVSSPATGLGIELGFCFDEEIPIICFFKENIKYTNALKSVTNNFIPYQDLNDFIFKLKEVLEK